MIFSLRKLLCLMLLASYVGNSMAADAIQAPNFKPVLALGGVGLAAAAVGFGILIHSGKLNALLEEKAIDAWIAKNDLNQFGEPKDTVYADPVRGPLKWNQSRIDHIKEKFVDEDVKPWRSGFKRLLDEVKNLSRMSTLVSLGGAATAFVAYLIAAYFQIKYEGALTRQSSELFKQALIDAVKSNPVVIN